MSASIQQEEEEKRAVLESGEYEHIEILDGTEPNPEDDDMEMDDEDMEGMDNLEGLEQYEMVYDPEGDYEGEEEGEGMEEMEEEEEIEDMSVASFKDHTDSVYTVAFSPVDSTIAVTGGGDDRGYLWNTTTGAKMFELTGHTDTVNRVAFSCDGKYVATGGMDGQALVWEVATGQLVVSCEGCTEVEWVAWHPKGPVLIAGSSDGNVWMWKVPSGHMMNVFAGHTDSVRTGMFTPDGKSLVTASEDSALMVWDPKTAQTIHRMIPGVHQWHEAPISALDVHADSIMVVTGSEDGAVKVTNTKTGKVVASLEKHTDSVESVAFSPQFPYLATGGLDGNLCIWETGHMHLRHTCMQGAGIVRVAWHPIQPVIFSASIDRNIKAWDARTGAELKQWTGHRDTIMDLAISSDGTKILTGADDHMALVFNYQA